MVNIYLQRLINHPFKWNQQKGSTYTYEIQRLKLILKCNKIWRVSLKYFFLIMYPKGYLVPLHTAVPLALPLCLRWPLMATEDQDTSGKLPTYLTSHLIPSWILYVESLSPLFEHTTWALLSLNPRSVFTASIKQTSKQTNEKHLTCRYLSLILQTHTFTHSVGYSFEQTSDDRNKYFL